jgi:SAM-dependent methyltransferase
VAYWEVEAQAYYREHAGFLGTDRLMWCPEGVDESEARLLGDVAGKRVLEVGCGGAQGARWAAAHGAQTVGLDLAEGMLKVALELGADGIGLIQGDATALPFAPATFDLAFAAMGALPHLPSPAAVCREVARVLRPGGRWVFSTDHPFAWVFPDAPGRDALRVKRSYFDRTPYFERDEAGRLVDIQYHATFSDLLGGLAGAGFAVDRVVEPEWSKRTGARDGEWAAWSSERGALVPSSVIIASHLI